MIAMFLVKVFFFFCEASTTVTWLKNIADCWLLLYLMGLFVVVHYQSYLFCDLDAGMKQNWVKKKNKQMCNLMPQKYVNGLGHPVSVK